MERKLLFKLIASFFLFIFRWEKSTSPVRVPTFELEYKSKEVPSKVGSFDYITHKPGYLIVV